MNFEASCDKLIELAREAEAKGSGDVDFKEIEDDLARLKEEYRAGTQELVGLRPGSPGYNEVSNTLDQMERYIRSMIDLFEKLLENDGDFPVSSSVADSAGIESG